MDGRMGVQTVDRTLPIVLPSSLTWSVHLLYGQYTGQLAGTRQPRRKLRDSVLLSTCPCWWKLLHSDYEEDVRILHNSV